jgi:hypothetical protein
VGCYRPEDVAMEMGVVVTLDGRVFTFQFDWLHRPKCEGAFRDWRWKELTSSWQTEAYPKEEVAIALQIVKECSSAD